MSFGSKLAELRKKNGITQEGLAEQLDVTRQTISKWELDQSTPDLIYIGKISDLFEVTTDYLIKDNMEEKLEENEETVAAEREVIREVEKTVVEVHKSSLENYKILGIIMTVAGIFLVSAGLIMTVLVAGVSYSYEYEFYYTLNYKACHLGILLVILGIERIIIKKKYMETILITCGIYLAVFLIYALFNGDVEDFITRKLATDEGVIGLVSVCIVGLLAYLIYGLKKMVRK